MSKNNNRSLTKNKNSSKTVVVSITIVPNPSAPIHKNLPDEKAERLWGRWLISNKHKSDLNVYRGRVRGRKRSSVCLGKSFSSLNQYSSIRQA